MEEDVHVGPDARAQPDILPAVHEQLGDGLRCAHARVEFRAADVLTGFRNGPTVAEAHDDAEFVAAPRAVDERLLAGEAPLGGRRFAPRRTALDQSPLALQNGADESVRAALVML